MRQSHLPQRSSHHTLGDLGVEYQVEHWHLEQARLIASPWMLARPCCCWFCRVCSRLYADSAATAELITFVQAPWHAVTDEGCATASGFFCCWRFWVFSATAVVPWIWFALPGRRHSSIGVATGLASAHGTLRLHLALLVSVGGAVAAL